MRHWNGSYRDAAVWMAANQTGCAHAWQNAIRPREVRGALQLYYPINHTVYGVIVVFSR